VLSFPGILLGQFSDIQRDIGACSGTSERLKDVRKDVESVRFLIPHTFACHLFKKLDWSSCCIIVTNVGFVEGHRINPFGFSIPGPLYICVPSLLSMIAQF